MRETLWKRQGKKYKPGFSRGNITFKFAKKNLEKTTVNQKTPKYAFLFIIK